jgi:hypothetical protein
MDRVGVEQAPFHLQLMGLECKLAEVVGSNPTLSISFCCTTTVLDHARF